MYWEISKSFDFCYGHRVWSQELNKDLALTECLKCRHLHGHQGKVIVYLKSNKLNKGMVTDFNHLNWFKDFLDNIDHKFIIDINDPLFNKMVDVDKNLLIDFKYYKIINLSNFSNIDREYYESFIIVDFVPTSENLSYWLLGIIKDKMEKLNIQVSRVEYFETPKSRSIVYSD